MNPLATPFVHTRFWVYLIYWTGNLYRLPTLLPRRLPQLLLWFCVSWFHHPAAVSFVKFVGARTTRLFCLCRSPAGLPVACCAHAIPRLRCSLPPPPQYLRFVLDHRTMLEQVPTHLCTHLPPVLRHTVGRTYSTIPPPYTAFWRCILAVPFTHTTTIPTVLPPRRTACRLCYTMEHFWNFATHVLIPARTVIRFQTGFLLEPLFATSSTVYVYLVLHITWTQLQFCTVERLTRSLREQNHVGQLPPARFHHHHDALPSTHIPAFRFLALLREHPTTCRLVNLPLPVPRAAR